MRGWIGVDLDGTIAEYSGWKGELHIGAPIPAMVERVKNWLDQGHQVKIFTARVSTGSNKDGTRISVEKITEAIQAWCVEHVGIALPVTNVKDYGMMQLWDDRAVGVFPNTGRIKTAEECQ